MFGKEHGGQCGYSRVSKGIRVRGGQSRNGVRSCRVLGATERTVVFSPSEKEGF